jgi:hypothetical protein
MLLRISLNGAWPVASKMSRRNFCTFRSSFWLIRLQVE